MTTNDDPDVDAPRLDSSKNGQTQPDGQRSSGKSPEGIGLTPSTRVHGLRKTVPTERTQCSLKQAPDALHDTETQSRSTLNALPGHADTTPMTASSLARSGLITKVSLSMKKASGKVFTQLPLWQHFSLSQVTFIAISSLGWMENTNGLPNAHWA